jgi:hypothetical protein
MRWTTRAIIAVLGTAIVLAGAGCAPDVVSIADPGTAAGVPQMSSVPVCGASEVSAPPGTLLTNRDVWPDGADTAIASAMVLDDAACRAAVVDDPTPATLSCEVGFPWYASTDVATELARLGVTRTQNSVLLHLDQASGAAGSNRRVAARVSEYVLSLSGAAAAQLEAAAVRCGATQLDGEQPPVYTIADDINGITVALQIGYRTAVGLTFTGAGLTDATKLALLGKAADLAAA